HQHLRSGMGYASEAVRDNEIRVEYLGVSAQYVVWWKYVLAAVLAALGGGIQALASGHVGPEMAYWTTSGEFVFIALLGGTAHVGAIISAAVIFEFIKTWVTRYLKPTTGTITFRGSDITGLLPRQVVRTGVCRSFQVSQLFRELTVLEHMLIAIGMMRAHRLSWLAPLHTPEHERHAREMLARYTIEQHAGAVVSTLPQGVRKLLDIAMATVAEPALLLLDEPTSR